jgi:hypothetical protein
VVGSAAELRVGVADEDSSLSDSSSSSDVDPSSVPVSESVAGAPVPVAGAVVVGDDGVDASSSSCCSEDDDAVVSSLSVVDLDVSVPPTMADTGFCPISSIPVTMPIAITNTAAA